MLRVVRAVACLTLFVSAAQASTEVTHVGRLLDSQGNAVSRTADLTFRIYGAADPNTAVWTEEHSDVTIDGGAYRVSLGSIVSLDDVALVGATLGVAIDGQELQPRQAVSSLRDDISRFVCEPGEVARASADGWTCGLTRTAAGRAELAVSQSGALPSTWTQVNTRTSVAADWDGFADQVSPGRALEARLCLSYTDAGSPGTELGLRVYSAASAQSLWSGTVPSSESASESVSVCADWAPVEGLAPCAVDGDGQCQIQMTHPESASTTLRRMWWEVSVN